MAFYNKKCIAWSNTSKPHCAEQQLDLETGNCEGSRGSESNRRTGCGKTSPPGLCGGRRVADVPAARCVFILCLIMMEMK